MKVILYMTITVNGVIAKKGGRATFISEESAESLNELARKTRCVIYGKNSFDGEPIKGALNVVLTHNTKPATRHKEFTFISGDPKEICDKLESDGYKAALLVGGSQTNKEFMEAGLIDEIFLDIEPVIFGTGIPLFAESDFEAKLEFIEQRRLSKNTLQIHFKVEK